MKIKNICDEKSKKIRLKFKSIGATGPAGFSSNTGATGNTGYTGQTGNTGQTGPGHFQVGAKVQNIANQLILSGSSQVLTYTSTIWDSVPPMHDNIVNNTRITVNVPGRYVIGSYVVWDIILSDVPKSRTVYIRKNGSGFPFLVANISLDSDGISNGYTNASTIDQAIAGDYYECYVSQNSGQTLAVMYTSFWAELISTS